LHSKWIESNRRGLSPPPFRIESFINRIEVFFLICIKRGRVIHVRFQVISLSGGPRLFSKCEDITAEGLSLFLIGVQHLSKFRLRERPYTETQSWRIVGIGENLFWRVLGVTRLWALWAARFGPSPERADDPLGPKSRIPSTR
jgi:hypothetical protein